MKKTVLITGGATGLGKEISKTFAKAGYDVVLSYHHGKEKAEELKREIEEDHHKVWIYPLDLSVEQDTQQFLEKVKKEVGFVDVLVNNAAVEFHHEWQEKTKEEFLYTLDVNLVGPFFLSKEIGRQMVEQGHGKIINIASNNAMEQSDPITVDYDASKAALLSLTHNLAKEFAPYVNVNAVAPGWILTDKVESLNEELNGELVKEEQKKILLNRFAKPCEIASVVLFLASDEASYINSEIIRIDGGMK